MKRPREAEKLTIECLTGDYCHYEDYLEWEKQADWLEGEKELADGLEVMFKDKLNGKNKQIAELKQIDINHITVRKSFEKEIAEIKERLHNAEKTLLTIYWLHNDSERISQLVHEHFLYLEETD